MNSAKSTVPPTEKRFAASRRFFFWAASYSAFLRFSSSGSTSTFFLANEAWPRLGGGIVPVEWAAPSYVLVVGQPFRAFGCFRAMAQAALRVSRVVSFPKLRAGAAPLCAGPSALSRTYRYIEMHGSRTSPCGPLLRQWSLAHASRGRRARERLDGAQSAARCLPHPRVLAPQYAIIGATLRKIRENTIITLSNSTAHIRKPRRHRSSPRSHA